MTKPWAKQTQTGFTIVELLIVIVVIAILAAITVVAYNGIQNRANDSAVEADIANIIKQMEITRIDLGRYPQIYSEFPAGLKLAKSAYDPTANNVYYIVDIQNDRYAFGLRSKSRKGYIINSGSIITPTSVSSVTTAAALGIPWGTNPGVSAVFQAYAGTTETWTGSWSWVN